MKKFLSIPVIILMMMFTLSSLSMVGTPPNQCLTVLMHVVPSGFESEPEMDPENKRLPPRPIICTISQTDGIDIVGCTSDFTSYEIWDAEGALCITVHTTEADFIDSLFYMTGEYQIRLISEDYELIGYITL